MLVGEGLVDAQVVLAPGEVRRGTRLLTGTRRTRDGVHRHIVFQQSHLGGGQQAELDGGGEAAGIGYVLRLLDLCLVDLRQAIDIVVVTLDAEVLCEVDNLHSLRNRVLLQEGLALAVAEAEEHDIDILEGHRVGKLQVGLAVESFVNLCHGIARIAL